MGFVEAISFLSDVYFVFIVTLALIAFFVVIIKEAINGAFSKGDDNEEDKATEIECACAYCPVKAKETAYLTAETSKTENNS